MIMTADRADQIVSTNPFNQQVLGSYPHFDLRQLDTLLLSVSQAQNKWQSSTESQRSELLLSLGRVLRQRQHELAALATAEMGKTLISALAEVEKCAAVCDYYAQHGPAMIGEDAVLADDGV